MSYITWWRFDFQWHFIGVTIFTSWKQPELGWFELMWYDFAWKHSMTLTFSGKGHKGWTTDDHVMAKPISTMSRIRYSAFWVWETNLTGKRNEYQKMILRILTVLSTLLTTKILNQSGSMIPPYSTPIRLELPLLFKVEGVRSIDLPLNFRLPHVFLASSVVMVMLRLSRTIRVPTDKGFVESMKASPEDEEKTSDSHDMPGTHLKSLRISFQHLFKCHFQISINISQKS